MIRNFSNSLPIVLILVAFLSAGPQTVGQAPVPVSPEPGLLQPPVSDRGVNSGVVPRQDYPRQDHSLQESSRQNPKRKIRDVLQGRTPAATGDGVLEDVLNVIQRQGSVLDGSSLDEPTQGGNLVPEVSGQSTASDGQTLADRRANVAEQLLRTARMLQQISNEDSSLALVNSMRRKAATLLIAGEKPTP